MNNIERTREASSFRVFFDDQLTHLHNLVGEVSSHIRDEMQQANEDKQMVENFVETSNSKIRAVSKYTDKLGEYVRPLHSHVLQIADKIPPPIDLNPDSFGTHALVNALFVNGQDIDKLFATDPNMSAFLRTYSKDEAPKVYAVLTAERHEKQTLGISMQGDMLLREVPQQAVNFSAYKIHTPSTSSTELAATLKEYLFIRVVALLKQEMAARIANQAFNAGDNTYEARVKSLANPDVYLKTLIESIGNPADLLSVEKIHFKLSKLGIKLENDDTQSANEFDIYELVWRNNIRKVVLQITHTR